MEIDIARMREGFLATQTGKASRHAVADRIAPSRWQYDYLTLHLLVQDINTLVAALPVARPGARALDLGSDKSPYRALLESRGYEVRTLDMTLDGGADYVGTAEATGLPDESFDVVLCTQVLEHCMNPWVSTREIRRILRPDGRLIASAPHVWFFHPHPTDHWRFTQQGMVQLCREARLEPERLLAQGGSIVTLCQVINFLAYGVLGRLGAPLYAVLNTLGLAGDGAAPNNLFCHNFAVLARRA